MAVPVTIPSSLLEQATQHLTGTGRARMAARIPARTEARVSAGIEARPLTGATACVSDGGVTSPKGRWALDPVSAVSAKRLGEWLTERASRCVAGRDGQRLAPRGIVGSVLSHRRRRRHLPRCEDLQPASLSSTALAVILAPAPRASPRARCRRVSGDGHDRLSLRVAARLPDTASGLR